MVLVCHPHNFIYLKTYKTASTSVEMYLEPHCAPPGHEVVEATKAIVSPEGIVGARLQGPRQYLLTHWRVNWKNHMPAKHVQAAVGREVWDGSVRIATIRNPFDRLVSSFHWSKSQKNASATRDFAATRAVFKSRMLRYATDTNFPIMHIRNDNVIDHAIRFEHLRADLARLDKNLGLPHRPGALPVTKSTSANRNGRSVAEYYDAETIAIVRKTSAWVFERFNYPDHPEQLLPLSSEAIPEPVQ